MADTLEQVTEVLGNVVEGQKLTNQTIGMALEAIKVQTTIIQSLQGRITDLEFARFAKPMRRRWFRRLQPTEVRDEQQA